MRLITLLISLLLGLNSWALTYDGDISKTKTSLTFTNKADNKKYALTGASPLISVYLNKLSDGDFISIDATIDTSFTKLTVASINYVGLKSLLGTWFGDDNSCYNFINNTDFSISQRSGHHCLPPQGSSYTYLLNPNSNVSAWVMLVAGEYGSYVGDLKVHSPNNVALELYDSETGEVLRYLNLTKAK